MKFFSFLLVLAFFSVLLLLRNYDKLAPKIFTRFLFVIFTFAFVFFSFFPNVLQSIADFFGLGRGVDLLLYGCVLGLLTLSGLVITKIRQMEERIAKLSRAITLDHPGDSSKL